LPMYERNFGEGFLWGTASSGFQVEMGASAEDTDPNTDWFIWARDEANVERGVVSGGLPENGPGFWRYYKQDLALAARKLNNNAVRLSVEWSRIFPEPTTGILAERTYDHRGNLVRVEITQETMKELEQKANQKAVQRYREILREAMKLKLTIMLNLNHFTLPRWLHDPIACRDNFPHSKSRGWIDSSTVVEFAKYAAFIAYTFGDLVDVWTTLNEPMVVSIQGYLVEPSAGFPPGLNDPDLCLQASRNLAMAHALAYEQMKKWDTKTVSKFGPAYVGVIVNPQVYEAYRKDVEEDVEAARSYNYFWNEWYLNAVIHGEYDMNLDMKVEQGEQVQGLIKGCDFIGVNYYNRVMVKGEKTMKDSILKGVRVPAERNVTDVGWEIYPRGLMQIVNWIYQKYRRPMIVTENGIADARDKKRSKFLLRHLEQLYNAITREKVPVGGYFHWSLTDNFEWAKGFSKRFGLFRVDYQSKERHPTRAVQLYSDICSRNALP